MMAVCMWDSHCGHDGYKHSHVCVLETKLHAPLTLVTLEIKRSLIKQPSCELHDC